MYFDTTLEIASTIEQRLREASIRCEKWMSTGWEVKGCFNEEYKLVFLLYSPTHVENYFKLWWSTMQYFVKRRKLNKELLALANVIEQTILLKLGDRDKPWIMLGNPVFRAKIREWLKVLRKANCAVVMATQSLSDAKGSGILDVLVES